MKKIAAKAFVGARGTDSVQAITRAQAVALKTSGIDFCIRYLGGVTLEELDGILDAGLGFMPVTYSRAPGWLPSASIGSTDGTNAGNHCTALELPAGVTAWLDLEGPGGHAADVEDYVNAAAHKVQAVGYEAGLYVGYGTLLTSHELYKTAVTRYWRSISRVTDSSGALAEPDCGWCMNQLRPSRMWAGLWADINVVEADYKGRLPTWTIKAA